jgi:hypothetical protein
MLSKLLIKQSHVQLNFNQNKLLQISTIENRLNADINENPMPRKPKVSR